MNATEANEALKAQVCNFLSCKSVKGCQEVATDHAPSTHHLPLARNGLRDRGCRSERSFCLWIILPLNSHVMQLCWRVPRVLHLAWWCKAGVVERGPELGGEVGSSRCIAKPRGREGGLCVSG